MPKRLNEIVSRCWATYSIPVDRRKLKMDKIAGFVEVEMTNDSYEIIIGHPASQLDSSGLDHFVLSPRHARHLANVLIEHANQAEAEAAGRHVESRPNQRRNTSETHNSTSLSCGGAATGKRVGRHRICSQDGISIVTRRR